MKDPAWRAQLREAGIERRPPPSNDARPDRGHIEQPGEAPPRAMLVKPRIVEIPRSEAPISAIVRPEVEPPPATEKPVQYARPPAPFLRELEETVMAAPVPPAAPPIPPPIPPPSLRTEPRPSEPVRLPPSLSRPLAKVSAEVMRNGKGIKRGVRRLNPIPEEVLLRIVVGGESQTKVAHELGLHQWQVSREVREYQRENGMEKKPKRRVHHPLSVQHECVWRVLTLRKLDGEQKGQQAAVARAMGVPDHNMSNWIRAWVADNGNRLPKIANPPAHPLDEPGKPYRATQEPAASQKTLLSNGHKPPASQVLEAAPESAAPASKLDALIDQMLEKRIETELEKRLEAALLKRLGG